MSGPRPTLAILTHESDGFRERPYLAKQMIPHWEALGLDVVVATDAEDFAPADVALLHVDLSVTPERALRLAERYPRVLNGGVHDIRKRSFSRVLVSRDGPDPGPVIVKTNWNCGGRHDLRLAILESRPARALRGVGLDQTLHRLLEWREEHRHWSRRRWLPTSQYRVFATRAEVPAAVWSNPDLVVERFLSEREGDEYCCRHWLFVGDREVNRRTLSLEPVVKGRARLEPLDAPIPEELRAIRKRMGFDYGKFDYGIVDGRLVLYDVNRTPGLTSDPRRHEETVATLAPGIRAFFPGLA